MTDPTTDPAALAAGLVRLLDVDEIDTDLYRGARQPGGVGRVFGGQVIAQALQAAQAASGHMGTMPHAKPVHPHAYVTFGAGMRQKEIDMYSAENPLAGISTVTGATEDGLVPYYVPM